MFYSRFLETVEAHPNAIAVEMQHSAGSSTPQYPDGIERYTSSELRQEWPTPLATG